jgi:hypothetical protein
MHRLGARRSRAHIDLRHCLSAISLLLIDGSSRYGPEPLSLASVTPVPVAQPSFGLNGGLVCHAIAATRAAATTAMRAVRGSAPGRGTVVTGEGAMYYPQEPTGAAA